MTGVKKQVMANVGEVVEITWMDAKGEMTVREYTAPPAATREALRRPEVDLPVDVTLVETTPVHDGVTILRVNVVEMFRGRPDSPEFVALFSAAIKKMNEVVR